MHNVHQPATEPQPTKVTPELLDVIQATSEARAQTGAQAAYGERHFSLLEVKHLFEAAYIVGIFTHSLRNTAGLLREGFDAALKDLAAGTESGDLHLEPGTDWWA